MKISVFTSNLPRHISLIQQLTIIADEVNAIVESTTIFPGRRDDFQNKSPVMQAYFQHVIAAEREIFGSTAFIQSDNLKLLPITMGDLSLIRLDEMPDFLSSDLYIVFGASYIKGALCDFLVEQHAINIHMGVSPYYRGSATNFWPMFDNQPEYVGATIHYLSHGLDSGDILFHALPQAVKADPFYYTMSSVKAAHQALIQAIRNHEIHRMKPVPQNKTKEIRYSRYSDFNDEIASHYLSNLPNSEEVYQKVQSRDLSQFIRPVIL